MDSRTFTLKTLGKKAVEVEFEFRGKQHHAFYKHMPSDHTWSLSLPFVHKHWRKFAERDIRLYVGNGEFIGEEGLYDAVIALPKISTIDVVEVARIGIHNNDAEYWRSVKSSLEQIYKVCPFEFQFADQAGAYASFLKKPTDAQARRFVDIIVEIDSEAFAAIQDEDVEGLPETSTGPDLFTMMRMIMTMKGKFRLWWD
jgi:hypothetical protein